MSEALERARSGCGACAVRNQANCSDCIEALLAEVDRLCEALGDAHAPDIGARFLSTLESLHASPEVMAAATVAVSQQRTRDDEQDA